MAVYGPVRHQKSFFPYNIFLVMDRSIYCHMTLSAMNYLLYIAVIVHHHLFNHFFHNVGLYRLIYVMGQYRGSQFYWWRKP